MMCAWKEFLAILPVRYRKPLDAMGAEEIEELRLRINAPPELILRNGWTWLEDRATREDLSYILNTASRYSPWTASTASQGYLTAQGGHRIGICGEGYCENGRVSGIRQPSSLCIRLAKDYPGIAEGAGTDTCSTLIIGAPGWGKTTLLRDLIRKTSRKETVCVVDERCELFPKDFTPGKHMDVLTGCPKPSGINMLLRAMGPAYIAVDEITAEEDCQALIQASSCGVSLLATAHAVSLEDLQARNVYRTLMENRVFARIIVLQRNKSYTVERMES